MIKRIKEMYSKSKFSKNTAPKVLSLVFAIVFWIFVIDNVNPEMTRVIENVSVELIGVDQLEANGYKIMGDRDFTLDLTIKGRRNDVIKMNKSDVQITADLGKLENGFQEIPLNSEIGNSEIILVSQTRESILLKIDDIIRIPIPVTIKKSGSLPEDYYEESTRLSLEEIFISGPETYVNMVKEMVGQVSLNNVTELLVRDLAVIPVDSEGETVTGVDVETNYVTVSVDVSKRNEILVHPKYEGNVAEGYQLTEVFVEPVTVFLRGHRDDINALKYIETEVVDLKDAKDSFAIEMPLNIPTGMILEDLNQRVSINFKIEEIVTKEFSFDYSEVTILNMDPLLNTNISTLEGQLLLKVSAVESLISNLTKNDLGLFIDGKDFKPGVRKIKVLLNRSNEFNKVEILPEIVEILISKITP